MDEPPFATTPPAWLLSIIQQTAQLSDVPPKVVAALIHLLQQILADHTAEPYVIRNPNDNGLVAGWDQAQSIFEITVRSDTSVGYAFRSNSTEEVCSNATDLQKLRTYASKF